MALKSNLVPSKDALRALRSLALSPHIVLIGTFSSVCGLATVHCHERRKLAIAEKILETKRTIHTISRGRGVDQVKRMFEAAERGEDFTLHHGRPMKPQKRNQSTIAVMRAHEDSESFLIGHDRVIANNDCRREADGNSMPQPDGINHQAQTEMPLHQPFVESRPPNRSKEASIARTAIMPRNFRDFATQAREVRQGKQRHLILKRLQNAGRLTKSTDQNDTHQRFSDLNPPPSTLDKDGAAGKVKLPAVLSSEESLFFNFVFGKQSHDELYEGNVFHAMHPWEQSRSEFDVIDSVQSLTSDATRDQNLLSHLMENVTEGSDSSFHYLESGASIPERSFSHTLESRFIVREDNILQVEHDNELRYPFIFNQIAQTLHDLGAVAGLMRLEQVFETYIGSGNKADFTLLKLLILEFAHHFDSKSLASTIRKVVRKNLMGQAPKLYTVGLLYPHFGDAPNRSGSLAYYYAMRYLEESCTLTSSYEEQKAELDKVIEGTLQCNIALSEHLLLPILRYQYSKGSMKQAQELLDEMKEKYSINTTFYTSSELIRGYASTGNWWKVRAILAELHAENKSRQKFHGYAALFTGVLDEYMSKHSIDSSCTFVMQTIKEAGLIPISPVSTRVVLGCIRERRYDLLRQYVNMIQRDFPFLETGFGRATFASHLAATWKEMEATCEDILDGCVAMAVNAIRDPFSNTFRGMVSETVMRDLSIQIQALESHGPFKLLSNSKRLDVDSLVENIRLLIKNHHKNGFTPITRSLAEKLVQKTRTLMNLDRLLSGSQVGYQEPSEGNQQSTIKRAKTDRDQRFRMPPGLKALRLPSLDEVVSMLEKFYEGRHNRDLPVDHSILLNIITRLSQQSRQSDAYNLMEIMYQSRWVQPPLGTSYDIDLYTQWLRLALLIRSGGKVKDVIWAVLETGSELELTGDFLLLARIAIPKTLLSRHTRARSDDIDEGEYLNGRLRRRRAQELSRNDSRGVIFSTWKKMGGS